MSCHLVSEIHAKYVSGNRQEKHWTVKTYRKIDQFQDNTIMAKENQKVGRSWKEYQEQNTNEGVKKITRASTNLTHICLWESQCNIIYFTSKNWSRNEST